MILTRYSANLKSPERVPLQVTCGGVQSAHTAAVAAACAERGMRAHLLIRGERPAVITGYHLYTRMLGQVTYVARSEYADRRGMMTRHHQRVCDANPDAKVLPLLGSWQEGCGGSILGTTMCHVWESRCRKGSLEGTERGANHIQMASIASYQMQSFTASSCTAQRTWNPLAFGYCSSTSSAEKSSQYAQYYDLAEGAADPIEILGSIRLICHLADTLAFPTDRECSLVVDSGTGTTAVGDSNSQNLIHIL